MSYIRFFYLAMFSIGIFTNAFAQCNSGAALNLYWKGGSGNYNTPSNWWVGSYGSGVEPCQSPRSSDNVYFPANAFPNGGTVLIDQNSNCKNMVWDNAIGSNTAIQEINNGVILSIYGNLELASNMNFGYNGHLTFARTVADTATILSRGKNLCIGLFRIALGPNTTLKLLDNLTVNNPSNNNATANSGTIKLESGHFFTNGFTLSADAFISNNANVSRRLTISNSTLIVDATTAQSFHPWQLDFSANNFSGFAAANSSLVINCQRVNSFNVLFGNGLTYGNISIWLSSGGNDMTIGACSINADSFYVGANTVGLMLSSGANISANTFRIGANAQILSQNGYIKTNNFAGPGGCGMAVLMGWSGIQRFRLGTITPGIALQLQNALLNNVECVSNAGSTFVAHNSVDGSNNSNISVFAPTSCPNSLYFKDNGNHNWHDPTNWTNVNGLVMNMVPNAATDVYFNALSFPYSIKQVYVDSLAFCRNMQWTNIDSGATIRMGAYISITGNLQFHPSMSMIQGAAAGGNFSRGFAFFDTCSVATNGVSLGNMVITTAVASNVTFVDTLTMLGLTQYAMSRVNAANVGISIASFYRMARRDFNNVRIYMTASGPNALNEYDSSYISYTNNTRLYLRGNGQQRIEGILPNTYFENPQITLSRLVTILGDLYINKDCPNLSMQQYGNIYYAYLNITGNLNIAAGKQVVMTDNPGSFIRVQGNLNMGALGSCLGTTSLRTYSGMPITLTVLGSANIYNAFIANMQVSAPITAFNSVDGGGNSNITFTSAGTGLTFYWRGNMNNPTVFSGAWSDPNHWTTNPASAVGDGLCVPSISDNVIFNAINAGFVGATYTVTIQNTAFCNSFTTSDAVCIAHSNATQDALTVNGSFSLHSTTLWSFAGVIDFVGGGNIRVPNVILNNRAINFNSGTNGSWTLQSDLYYNSPINNYTEGIFRLLQGTFDANNYNVTISNRFESSGTKIRTLNMGNGTWTMLMNGIYVDNGGTIYRPWMMDNATNLTLIAGGSTLRFMNGFTNTGVNSKRPHLGTGLQYNKVFFTDTDETIYLLGTARFNYLLLESNMFINSNNAMDSLGLKAGYTVILKVGTTQTLNAPHGKIVTVSTNAGSFINVESSVNNQLAYIHKAYGNQFCVDYIKVRDVLATKESNMTLVPTSPVNYQLIHAALQFQTGINSDSISIAGGNWGLWAFSLPPLVIPSVQVIDSITFCKVASEMSFPIQCLGTSPYIVTCTWTDNMGNVGTDNFAFIDNDYNELTPSTHQIRLPFNQSATAYNYQINISTLRCGFSYSGAAQWTYVQIPRGQLVTQNSYGSCDFKNEPIWFTMLDANSKRPMISVLDSSAQQSFVTGTSPILADLSLGCTLPISTVQPLAPLNTPDNSALGQVRANVNISNAGRIRLFHDCAEYNVLKRWWKVEYDSIRNSSGANNQSRIRLYFLSGELYRLFNIVPNSSNSQQLALTDLAQSFALLRVDNNTTVSEAGGMINLPVNADLKGIPFSTFSITQANLAPFTANLPVPDTFFQNAVLSASAIINGSDTSAVLGIEFLLDRLSNPLNGPDTAAHFFLAIKRDEISQQTLLGLNLLNFEAHLNTQKGVDLSWQIEGQSTELLGFEIERATDLSGNGQILGIVPQNGQESGSYEFNDPNVQGTWIYYRLKMTFTDGHYEYSDWKVIQMNSTFENEIKVYPNPSNGTFNIAREGNLQEDISVKIIDMLGRELWQQLLPAGLKVTNIQTEGLAEGIYDLKLQMNNGATINRKIVISK